LSEDAVYSVNWAESDVSGTVIGVINFTGCKGAIHNYLAGHLPETPVQLYLAVACTRCQSTSLPSNCLEQNPESCCFSQWTYIRRLFSI